MLRRIYDAVYEPETGLKALITKNTQTIWGNGKTQGLTQRVTAIEDLHESEEKQRSKHEARIYRIAVAIAGVMGTIVAVVARELMRHFGI